MRRFMKVGYVISVIVAILALAHLGIDKRVPFQPVVFWITIIAADFLILYPMSKWD